MKYCTIDNHHHHGSYHQDYLVDVAVTPVPERNKMDLVLTRKIHLGGRLGTYNRTRKTPIVIVCYESHPDQVKYQPDYLYTCQHHHHGKMKRWPKNLGL